MQMQLINILFFRYILENLKIMKNCRTYIYSSRHSPLLKKEKHLDIMYHAVQQIRTAEIFSWTDCVVQYIAGLKKLSNT